MRLQLLSLLWHQPSRVHLLQQQEHWQGLLLVQELQPEQHRLQGQSLAKAAGLADLHPPQQHHQQQGMAAVLLQTCQQWGPGLRVLQGQVLLSGSRPSSMPHPLGALVDYTLAPLHLGRSHTPGA